jgi:hypothetical protein
MGNQGLSDPAPPWDLVALHLRPLEIERLTIAIRFSYSDHGLSQAKGLLNSRKENSV